LTGHKTIQVRDGEGDGEMGNGKENKREREALHDSLDRWKEGKVKEVCVGSG
jgi:hypothetical protein